MVVAEWPEVAIARIIKEDDDEVRPPAELPTGRRCREPQL
jgi:hypothetical protein